MDMVYSSTVQELGPDKVCWKLVRSRGFEVRGFYLSFYPPTLLSFPWRMIWHSKVPPRVAFFSWFASLGKILTTDNLCKRRVLVLDWCYMCKSCGESMDHLLLHCPIACELWSLVLCLFGIHWVMPHKVIGLFESWQDMFGWHRNIVLWRLVPHCLLWCIWRERNARSFEGCELSLLEIKSFFFTHSPRLECGLLSYFLFFPSCFAWSW